MKAEHISVLLNECVDALNIREDGIYVDATLGMGGHTFEIVKKLKNGKLIAIDRDFTAIQKNKEKLGEFEDKIIFVNSNFSEIDRILIQLKINAVDGILADLGVSSPQLDEAERGFSYTQDAFLDMRMDKRNALTAAKVVNEESYENLVQILRDYGEERYAPQIVRAIIKAREKQEIKTTCELSDIIRSAMPQKALKEKQHPAKRTFQAIRIAVNDELSSIEIFMDRAPLKLNKGGRLAVISFHSLEDRIIKNKIQELENPCICPRDLPVCTCGRRPLLKRINRKPILPGEDELKYNPRSRSAKLRIAERV